MRVAALQMSSQRNLDENLEQAAGLLDEAAAAGVELAVLPENFSYLGAVDADRLAVAEAPGSGPAQRFLSAQARRHGLWIVGGTIPIRDGATARVHSRSMLVAPDGGVVAQYDKLHLFDVVLPGDAAETYRESDTTLPGEAPVVASTPFGPIGLTVCYDLRFPALFHRLGVLGMDILVVPAAFTVPTGRAHWQPLLVTRAFESLTFLIAAGQWGEHAGGRLTYGHSSIISPWGDVLAQRAEGIGIVTADIDLASLRGLRQKFPVIRHRREF
jgi:deaminated glutathione amidase